MNLQEILVPVDFSQSSLHALETAVPLARQLGAKIVLFHVVDVAGAGQMGPASEYEQRLTQLVREARARLDKIVSQCSGQNVGFETVVVEGLPHEAIVEFGQKRSIGIIILGKHKGKFWQFFRRHTAEAVQERASCLVQVVGEDEVPDHNRGLRPQSSTVLM